MKIRGQLILACTMVLSIVAYILSGNHILEIRSDYRYRVRAAALPVSNEMLSAIVGEFEGLAADYLLLEAASFIGSSNYDDASPEDWDAVARLLDQSSFLDPYFSQTYRLAQATLPWHTEKVQETITILTRSKNHRTWDWLPSFFMGFNYFYFLNDNLTASKVLMHAANIPGAPVPLATLASRLASKAGQAQVALDFLVSIHDRTEDDNIRLLLEKRILTLRGVVQLQAAIEQFKHTFGRLPETLDELVTFNILPRLPENPSGKSFTYADGKVDF